MCIRQIDNLGKQYAATVKGVKFYKVKVSGLMDKDQIIKACNAVGLKPVCDHLQYNDEHCVAASETLHYSDAKQDKKLGIPKSKAQDIFWYTGRQSTGSRYNSGQDKGRFRDSHDKYGYTMCARH
jgi:hypothetical protein